MWIKKAVRGFMALSLFVSFNAGQAVADSPVLHPAIPLYDENGAHVLDSNKPYSSRRSCGNNGGSGCHDYDAITKAYHFQFGRDEASDDFGPKRGLSRLVSSGYYGGYNCMGGNNNPIVLAKKSNKAATDFADKGSAGWITRCNGCHQGGGWMEKDRNGKRYDETDPNPVAQFDGDYYNRGSDSNNRAATSDVISQWDWKKSGVAEADCMFCHADFTKLKKFDPQLNTTGASDALTHFRTLRGTYLAAEGFFRYMGTAILEFLNINATSDTTMDKSAVVFSRSTSMPSGDHIMVHTTTTPTYYLELGADGQPVVKWNAAAFDANRKIVIPMLRFPGNDNCMNCHRTSNSRRGFYGLGEAAAATYDGDGNIIPDYKDDVHKGKVWTENGVARSIDNCNTCHSRGYFKGDTANADLDANHDIPKGNSEMTIRDDLDYTPKAKSCIYCHNDAQTPSIPSGHKDMLSAHRERWKTSGHMAGYPQDTLSRITQTHLDVIACQTCHINGIKNNGVPIKLMYRYRAEEDGALRIFPYNPTVRYYWKDKVTGYMFNSTERYSIFSVKPDPNDSTKSIGVITDPLSGQELGTVPVTVSHGSASYGVPSNYDGYVALKNAYDSLLRSKGVSNPDAVMVWTETAEYIITHNTRPAVSSVQCTECHSKKQDGSFSSLIRPDGLLGETPITIPTSLPEKTLPVPDRRLIDDGIVILDLPYMKLDGGIVKENISDILYATKVNPSLSVLNAARSRVALLAAKELGVDSATGLAKIADAVKVKEFLTTQNVFVFAPNTGDDKIKGVAVMAEADTANKLLFPTYKMEFSLADDAVLQASSKAGFGGVDSRVFSLKAFDANSQNVATFTGKGLLVKLPYDGKNTNPDQVKVITSSDGSSWTAIAKEDIKIIETGTADTQGYIVFATSHFSYFALADSTVAVSGDESAAVTASSDSKGFCFIATAAYGSYEEPHVQVLREFRDRILMTNRIGDAFVRLYYNISPPAAEWIARHDTVRTFVRMMLIPLFALAYFLLKLSLAQQIVSLFLVSLGVMTVYMLIKRRKMVEAKA